MNLKSEYSVLSISNALSNVYGLSGVVKDWWVRDDEMISVALMGDVHGGGGGRCGKKGGDEVKDKRSGSMAAERSGDESEKNRRGGERLGQTCVLVELVNKLRTIRRLRDDLQISGGNTEEIAKLLVSSFFSPLFVLSFDQLMNVGERKCKIEFDEVCHWIRSTFGCINRSEGIIFYFSFALQCLLTFFFR
jgi:hypothetical protein